MDVYTIDNEMLEAYLDSAKAAIVAALKKEGLISTEKAESWAESHSVIIRTKSIFRTISDKWGKIRDEDKTYFIVVKKI